ncbi:hypothetical protein PPACK8108_LOCUS644 [Phakopsora pachyrhizi]|uniref:Uncharacterized protein n=1 Tax=Phakopsora pachyrhizi TaxID=170000 RepID=A0AAV0AE06_PHAPC|nr:hypothetical protein PPACK8108_LOCUS644 [Phakopsora pachyrhizi]
MTNNFSKGWLRMNVIKSGRREELTLREVSPRELMKFRGECYETVKIQREVALNQFAIKGRSGNVKQGINETDIEGNLNLSGVRQTTTQDKQLNKEQE